jgi:hypothetical protein
MTAKIPSENFIEYLKEIKQTVHSKTQQKFTQKIITCNKANF